MGRTKPKGDRELREKKRVGYNEWRGCSSKRRYRDEKQARQSVRWCASRRGESVRIYFCTRCKGYHLTSKDFVDHGQ